MTDARFPDRWLNDRRFVRLTDREFRGFVEALVWSVANRTDGHIPKEDVDLFRWCSAEIAAALNRSGLLIESGHGWQIDQFELTQTTSAQLEAADRSRIHERHKKRRQRAHRDGDHAMCTAETCDRVSPGTSPGTAEDRLGQARTGKRQATTSSPDGLTWPDVMEPSPSGEGSR